MPKRNVWIAIPAYTGTIHLGTMRSLQTELLTFIHRGDDVYVFDESGNALLADARALMVAKFLDGDGTDLVFLDADVVCEADTIVNLVDAPVECVSAIYPQRKDPIEYPISWDQSQPQLIPNDDGLLEVWGVPFGCTRCSREMLTKMVEHYTDLEYECALAPKKKAWALFDPYRIGKFKFGEDYAFCRRWRDIGGKIWITPEATLGHIGYKTFKGNIGQWLRHRTEPSS